MLHMGLRGAHTWNISFLQRSKLKVGEVDETDFYEMAITQEADVEELLVLSRQLVVLTGIQPFRFVADTYMNAQGLAPIGLAAGADVPRFGSSAVACLKPAQTPL